jgi:hypothetical protein
MDPVAALEDFRRRVANYEKAYEPIGEYEEEVENLQYCKVLISTRVVDQLDDQCRQEVSCTQHTGLSSRPGNLLPLKFQLGRATNMDHPAWYDHQ